VSGFQRGNGLLSGDAGKRVEELVEAVVPFEIVNQVAEGDPRPDKHGSTAENLWVTVNDAPGVRHVRPPFVDSSAMLRVRLPALEADRPISEPRHETIDAYADDK
jgi:hypothetical protein